MSDAIRLEDAVEFAENPEPRCPCILLLDTSGSMGGLPIEALNDGLETFRDELNQDDLARKRVEVAVVSFDSKVNVVLDFVTADRFEAPVLTAQGLTSMGTGLQKALDLLDERKRQYRDNGITYYRPWIFTITDGEPQGEPKRAIEEAMARLRDDEANKRVACFAVGVENANMERLGEIFPRTPLKLKGLDFRELFVWLSASMQRVSNSQPDDQVPLPPPGWGEV
ncbi:MAG: hypothetical protein HLUCCO16_21720 [Phormidium sp. OSCR]|nr:MAG: hypothetical protein HLUCCO16_21720 [Phormidium sp. OSCR]